MTLIELILEYGRILRRDGQDVAYKWLQSIGIPLAVQDAIYRTYNQSGHLINSDGEVIDLQKL